MGKPAFKATPEQMRDLATRSNRDMAKTHGASASTWSRIREQSGIPRFRPPTTVGGVAAPWVAKPERAKLVPGQPFGGDFWRAPEPTRDHSVAGEAASFLRRERFHVYNRKIVGEEGWQVGRSQLSECDMIAKAKRLGFVQEGWMG